MVIYQPIQFIDQNGAYSVAEWMRRADLDATLSGFFDPYLREKGDIRYIFTFKKKSQGTF
jgi:hypothetical protein